MTRLSTSARRAAPPLTALASAMLALAAASPAGAQASSAQVSGAHASGPRTPTRATAALTPPIPFHERTLANGLRLYWAVDKTTPNVTVQVWYHVGGKNDPPGRSGFAHLFEHLMFKGARDMAPEEMDRLTEDVGGFNNASTWDDLTNFYEVIPANHLDVLLWAEAERMSSLVVDQANFASERQVVEEELRQRVLADPYGRLTSYLIPEASFTVHPYKRPVIGSIGDLDAASLPEVKAFHATYYRPDNANLIVIGNFDPDQLNAWVDRDFGAIRHPDAPIPRVTVVEPPRPGPKSVTGYAPTVPLPAVAMTFLAPPGASPDSAVMAVIDAILSTGHASRLYSDLVYQQQLAEDAFTEYDEREQPGLFIAGLILADGKTPDQGEAALRSELARLRNAPVGPEELARAKNQLVAQILRERETVDGRAEALGRAIILEGDAGRANSDVAAIQAVDAADIQRAARLYLADDRRVTIRYLSDTAQPKTVAGSAAAGPAAVSAPSPAKPSAAVAASAPTAVQSPPPPESLPHAPPAPTALIPPAPLRYAERTLANGLRVVVARTSSLPIVTAELVIRGGAAADPPGEAGLTSLTADLLPRGTATRSAPQVSSAVERLGGSLDAATHADGSHLTLTVLADQLGAGLPILADVARHPAFAPAELERLRRQKLDGLALAMKDPAALERLALGPLVFGGSPYGHPIDGDPQSLARLTRAEVAAQYAREVRPDNAILVLTGDIQPDQGFALAERTFGDWARPPTPLAPPPPVPAAQRPRVVVIDLPGAGQAAVALAGPSIGYRDPRFYEAEAANAVLGGGYSARLNEEVRIRRGLSYGASSTIDERRGTGVFVAAAQTRNDAAPEVAALLEAQVKALPTSPITPGELDARAAALVGEFGRTTATSAGLAGELATYALYGLPLDRLGQFTQRIDAVTPAEALAAAPVAMAPADASLLVVGDAKVFIDKLRTRYPDVQVIPAAALDLDSPTLTKGR